MSTVYAESHEYLVKVSGASGREGVFAGSVSSLLLLLFREVEALGLLVAAFVPSYDCVGEGERFCCGQIFLREDRTQACHTDNESPYNPQGSLMQSAW